MCHHYPLEHVVVFLGFRKLLDNSIISIFSRFSLIHKTGTPCTALSFCLRRKNEVLVALADNSLRCYDTGAFDLMALLYSLFFFVCLFKKAALRTCNRGE